MFISDFAVLHEVLSPYLTDNELEGLAAIVDEDDTMMFDLAIGFSEAEELKSIVESWRSQTPEAFKNTTYKKILSAFRNDAVHYEDEDIRFNTFSREVSDAAFKDAWDKEWDMMRVTIARMKGMEYPSFGPYSSLAAAALELYAFSKLTFIVGQGENKWRYAVFTSKREPKVNIDFLKNEHLLANETETLNSLCGDCEGFIAYLQRLVTEERKEGRVGRIRFVASAKSPRRASFCFNLVLGEPFGFSGHMDGILCAGGVGKDCEAVLDDISDMVPTIRNALISKYDLPAQEYLNTNDLFESPGAG